MLQRVFGACPRGACLAAGLMLAVPSPDFPAHAQVPSSPCADLPTPAGYGRPAVAIEGERPLLFVIVHFADRKVVRSQGYYKALMFEPSRATRTSVDGLYRAISAGRFGFTKAGIVEVLYPKSLEEAAKGSALEYDRIVTKLTSQKFPMLDYDRNGDGVVDERELVIVRVGPTAPGGTGQTRWHDSELLFQVGARGAPRSYRFRGRTANLDEDVDISVFAHEIFHVLGFPDHIYGPRALNDRASFFGGFSRKVASTDNRAILLDPYHRLRSGWIAPRFAQIGRSGSVAVWAASRQARSQEFGPVVLYHPARCSNEFFMLEFRNNRDVNDNFAPASGIAVWYVAKNTDHSLVKFRWPPPLTAANVNASNFDMFATYLVGTRGPGDGPFLPSGPNEFEPVWGDGTPSGVRLEVNFDLRAAPPTASVQWRPAGAPFEAVVGRASVMPGVKIRGHVVTASGTFPAARDGIVATLRPTRGAGQGVALRIERMTVTELRAHYDGRIEPGTYSLTLERGGARPVVSRSSPQAVLTVR